LSPGDIKACFGSGWGKDARRSEADMKIFRALRNYYTCRASVEFDGTACSDLGELAGKFYPGDKKTQDDIVYSCNSQYVGFASWLAGYNKDRRIPERFAEYVFDKDPDMRKKGLKAVKKLLLKGKEGLCSDPGTARRCHMEFPYAREEFQTICGDDCAEAERNYNIMKAFLTSDPSVCRDNADKEVKYRTCWNYFNKDKDPCGLLAAEAARVYGEEK